MDEFGFDAIFEDNGVNDQEVAEPEEEEVADTEEEETSEEGANEQEVAEPAQSAEENAKYAAARRKAEKDMNERIERAVADAKKAAADETANMLKGMGILNPYTGKPLATMEDLKAYAEAASKEQQEMAEGKLNEYGLSKEEIDALVQSHPDVVAARESSARLKELEAKAQTVRDRQVFDEEIAKIQEFDPRVKSFEDFYNDDKHEEMVQMVKEQGMKIHQAWKLAHFDDIVTRSVEASKQDTLNRVRGKEHLEKTGSRGDGGISIPSDILAEFQMMMPDASVEEIRKFYAKDAKRMKK